MACPSTIRNPRGTWRGEGDNQEYRYGGYLFGTITPTRILTQSDVAKYELIATVFDERHNQIGQKYFKAAGSYSNVAKARVDARRWIEDQVHNVQEKNPLSRYRVTHNGQTFTVTATSKAAAERQ